MLNTCSGVRGPGLRPLILTRAHQDFSDVPEGVSQRCAQVFWGTLQRHETRCDVSVMWCQHGEAPGHPAHQWRVPICTCHKASCTQPICRSHADRQRARRLATSYEAAADASGEACDRGSWEFTLSDSVQVRLAGEHTLGELRKASRAIVERAHLGSIGARKSDGWRIAGAETWHPEGDKTRAKGQLHAHIHQGTALLAWHPRHGWRRLPRMLSRLAFEVARAEWKNALTRITGATIDTDVDLHYSFQHYARPEWWHSLSYDHRGWPGWRARWRRLTRWGWFAPRLAQVAIPKAAALEQAEIDHAPQACPECGASADHVVGYCTALPLKNAKTVWHRSLRLQEVTAHEKGGYSEKPPEKDGKGVKDAPETG